MILKLLFFSMLENLSVNYPEAVSERYKIDKSGDGFELLSELGRKKECLFQAAKLILKEPL